ncbi:M15 family metallopeptidase [Laspinema olomoucense]|uniref:M15 family metallopeptidase n=1 Tax=Laspinema olomoucense TaxID=3231600 RepID=UPI0021BB313A|nr:M15 family metallopeptidase [Laspinema sp. D3d]MCT7975317.1 D-alanyl-D-alanine carboxypeptidase family protein [Laspinema sp. D3d]
MIGRLIPLGAIAFLFPNPSPILALTPSPAIPPEVTLEESWKSLLNLSPPPLPPLLDSSLYFPLPTHTPSATLYGHLAYAEAPDGDLIAVGNGQTLRQSAASQFEAMVSAAAADGVQLVPLSGFRTREAQHHVFYAIADQRGQTLQQRARYAAPPGHSEHHTGYALDIGDGSAPTHDLRVSFENTPAFRWLTANAATFGFELSFPENHPSVNYEPWHWRWVGDAESQQLFHQSP